MRSATVPYDEPQRGSSRVPVYTAVLKVPANTPVLSAVKEELEVEGDYVTRLEVYFPPGCCCLVGFQLRYGELPLAPSRPDHYFRGHGRLVEYDMLFPLTGKTSRLTLVAFNEDEKYDHALYITVYTKYEHEVEPRGLWARVLEALLAFLERIIGPRGRGTRA